MTAECGAPRTDTAETDDESCAEVTRERDHLLGERLPERVGLVPEEHQDIAVSVVLRGVELDAGPRQRRVHAVAEVHDGASCAVVEQSVGVERRDRSRVEVGDERLGRRCGAESRVDPALERDHEGR